MDQRLIRLSATGPDVALQHAATHGNSVSGAVAGFSDCRAPHHKGIRATVSSRSIADLRKVESSSRRPVFARHGLVLRDDRRWNHPRPVRSRLIVWRLRSRLRSFWDSVPGTRSCSPARGSVRSSGCRGVSTRGTCRGPCSTSSTLAAGRCWIGVRYSLDREQEPVMPQPRPACREDLSRFAFIGDDAVP
jgi:hypothetical protein